MHLPFAGRTESSQTESGVRASSSSNTSGVAPSGSSSFPPARDEPLTALARCRPALLAVARAGSTPDELRACLDAFAAATSATAVSLLGSSPDANPESACAAEVSRRLSDWQDEPIVELDRQDLRDLGVGEGAESGAWAPLDARLGPAAIVALWSAHRPLSIAEYSGPLRLFADQLAWAILAGRAGAAGPSEGEQFLSFWGHELRTPLTPLLMLLQTLERKPPSGQGPDRELLARLRRQALRMARMVGDLSDLWRVRAGRLELDRAPLDLAELLREVEDQFRPTLSRHRLDLVAPRDEGFMVHADRPRLERLVLNLLENAERLIPQGGTLEVVLSRDARRTRLTVSARPGDQRTAQSPHLELEGLVGPLDKLRGPSLGLALAAEIAARHGGSLSVAHPEGALPSLVVLLPEAPP